MLLNPSRVFHAHSLISPSNIGYVFFSCLEGLGAELNSRCISLGRVSRISHAISKQVQRGETLSTLISYVSKRFTDVIIRLQEIDWKNGALAYNPSRDVFEILSDQKAHRWRMFMALAVKDFHVDIGSLMDAFAPVVIQGCGEIKKKDLKSFPGWADIQTDTKRTYRDHLPPHMIKIVDEVDNWWPAVKKVRDILTHRQHEKIIFGHPTDGLLFQIYDGERSPKISLPAITRRGKGQAVDFKLYSAFVFSEVITLMDNLGCFLSPSIGVNLDQAKTMCQRIIPDSVYHSIEALVTLCRDKKGVS